MTVTTTDQAAPTIATASTQTQGNTTSTQADTPTKQYLKLAGLILGLSTVLLLMLLAFVTPLLNSGAKDLPLAVGGPEAVTTQITQGLQTKSPDAFDVSTYNTAEEATQAVKDRDAIGAITAGPPPKSTRPRRNRRHSTLTNLNNLNGILMPSPPLLRLLHLGVAAMLVQHTNRLGP